MHLGFDETITETITQLQHYKKLKTGVEDLLKKYNEPCTALMCDKEGEFCTSCKSITLVKELNILMQNLEGDKDE